MTHMKRYTNMIVDRYYISICCIKLALQKHVCCGVTFALERYKEQKGLLPTFFKY